jgi:Spy/CpxP family protein refolding chaperone
LTVVNDKPRRSQVKHRALTALLIVTAAFGIVLAQPGPGAAAPAPGAQAPMMYRMQKTAPGPAVPDMTPEQQEKIDALRVAQVKEMAPLGADLRVKQIELAALWRADEPDAKKIIAKVKEIGDLREKMEIARINHQFDIRKLLTPEQRKAMKKTGVGPGMWGRGMRHGMRGQMGRGGWGMQGGNDAGGPQCPMGQDGQPGCSGCDMH